MGELLVRFAKISCRLALQGCQLKFIKKPGHFIAADAIILLAVAMEEGIGE